MSNTDKNLAQDFFTAFQASRSDITIRLDALKSNATPPSDELDSLALDVAKLRKELLDATGYLPPYDQRQYENYLSSAEQSLQQLRSASNAKPKFSFKRKAAKATDTAIAQQTSHAESSSQILEAPSRIAIPSKNLSLSGYSQQYLTWSSLPLAGSTTSDLFISDIKDCVVNLSPTANGQSTAPVTITALHMRNVTNTVVILPAINGSALIHDLNNCTIALGCHQFRMHTSTRVNVYLLIQSNPIIEHCSSIAFAAYSPSLLPLVNDSNNAVSKHLSVQDFSHIRATPSPNWSTLPVDKQLSLEDWTALTNPASDALVAMLSLALPSHQ